MTKPIEKPRRAPLVHHPSDVLEAFGDYNAANPAWLEFDASVSEQIQELEANNRQFIRVRKTFNRQSSR